MTERRLRAARIGIVLAAFALLPVLATSSYRLRVFTLMVGFALFAIALNVVFGHTDQLFLFVGGLAGVSAYSAVYTAGELGVTPWLTLPIGVVLAGLLAATVSYIAAKRRFTVIIIAIFTLALQLSLNQIFIGARDITGGSDGIVVPNLLVTNRLVYYYLFVGLLAVFAIGYDRLVHSRYGLAFEAIREDEVSAAASGVDVVKYKTFAGTLGGVMIGLVGALYGFSEGFLAPAVYSFTSVDVLVLIMLTLGGMRTLLGPIVGAVIVFWINQVLAQTQGWRTFVFGVLLIVLFLYFRQGVVPWAAELLECVGVDVESMAGDPS